MHIILNLCLLAVCIVLLLLTFETGKYWENRKKKSQGQLPPWIQKVK